MPQRSMRSVRAALVIAVPLIWLGGCSMPRDPMYGPDAPRNGFGQPVHPIYGTQLPGTPNCCGGRD